MEGLKSSRNKNGDMAAQYSVLEAKLAKSEDEKLSLGRKVDQLEEKVNKLEETNDVQVRLSNGWP